MPNSFELNSLRGKITTAYVALVVGTVVLAIIAFLDLLFLERQVREGEVVSDLKDAVLEMRREEKNLFLYKDGAALGRADEHAAVSLDILKNYESTLMAITQQQDLSAMAGNLKDYRVKLNTWNKTGIADRHQIEEGIRTEGHKVYLSVESLATRERRVLEEAVQESQWFLLKFLLVIGVAIYLVGRQLRRVVITPIKKLEARLKPIAEGRFDQLHPPSSDREFMTFTDAFNRMLKELEIRQRRMLQSEKLVSLGVLSSGVAHELNNPLSNISSSCQLLMEELTEADPDQLNIWLKQIDSETERGRRIVRTLLEFGGQRVFQKERIRLLDIVNETRSLIDKTLRQNSAKLIVNVPGDLMLAVDKQRILQLLINLIQNALHASGEGARVTVSAVECEKGVSMIPDDAEVAGDIKGISEHEGRYTEILVSDDGPGIPMENLSKVFDPFFTTSDPGKGIGLGLFIVQEIVREHHGYLAIASRPRTGTQVIVLLPGEDANRD